MTLVTVTSLPSAKEMAVPSAAAARGRSVTPRRRARRGLEPMSVSPVRIRRPSRESAVLRERAERVEVAEDVAAEEALGQRLLARADRQVHLVRRRELLGDLEAGVAAADDEHRAGRDLRRVAVVRAVQLVDLGSQPGGERRVRGVWNGPVATTTWSAA